MPRPVAMNSDSGIRATALTGTLFVALIFATSRWGTTIGVGSLYISDALLLLALLNAAYSHRPRVGYGGLAEVRAPAVPALFVLFIVFVVVRAMTSMGNGPLVDWLRDAVPYLYGIAALMSAASFADAGADRRRRTARFLTVALTAHLAWTAVMVLTPIGQTLHLVVPFATAPLFELRPDIDAALNSVLAGICLRALMEGRHRLPALAGLVLAATLVLTLATRAGTISLFVVLAITFGLCYSSVPNRSPKRTWLVLTAGMLVGVAAVVLPATTPGQRIIATLVPGTAVSAQQLNAEGTAQARNLVWSGVIGWTTSTPERAVFGSGFGNDFLQQSGTLAYLEGTTYTGVRSPHDYFVGTFARLGLLGVGLIAGSILIALATIWRRRREIARDPLAPIAVGVVVAILPIASLGVVLEAPFGALPFFWSLGVLFTYRAADGGRRTPGGLGARLGRPSDAGARLDRSLGQKDGPGTGVATVPSMALVPQPATEPQPPPS